MADISHLRVVAGILVDCSQHILIARRPDDGRHGGGLWEFPGGKIHTDESFEQALDRELDEELGIRVRDSLPFMSLTHDYAERRIAIHFRLVSNWEGAVRAREQQDLAWVCATELNNYELMPADAPVIQKLAKKFRSEACGEE